jgi:NADPH:quinone reductase-like Zn-dependent oxidoreductase
VFGKELVAAAATVHPEFPQFGQALYETLIMKKIAVVTGATSGIGKAVAQVFAAQQFNLILTGRRRSAWMP